MTRQGAWRVLAGLILAVPLLSSVPTAAQHSDPPSPVATARPDIRASLDRIAAGSPSWRAALAAVAATGRLVLVVTPDDVVVMDPSGGRPVWSPFDRSVLAEVALVPADGPEIRSVLVVVNVTLLADHHSRRGSFPVEFEDDLDRIVIHEVFGHAIPYALAGGRSGRCSDPAEGQRVTEACSIQRENLVRGELGLGRRTDYGLSSLSLARRF